MSTTKCTDLAECVQKAEEKVTKLVATLERHMTQLEKRVVKVEQYGAIPIRALVQTVDLSRPYKSSEWKVVEEQFYALNTAHKAHYPDSEFSYDVYNVLDKLDNIKNANRKIIDAERIVIGWREKLSAEEGYLQQVADLPQAIHDLLTNCAVLTRQHLEENTEYTVEMIDKAVNDAIDRIYRDFIYTILPITGTITQALDVTVGRKGEINGIFIGENGQVRVETIGAGGYHIQRFHYRTLVYKIYA